MEKKLGRKNKLIPFILFNLIIVFYFNSFIYCEDYTLSQIAEEQEASASGIETMAGTVETTNEFNGNSQAISYDYVLQNNADGSKKMMITTHGIFTMQFLVDTKEGSVTYLMGNGSKKKFTLTEEEKAKLFANYQINFNSGLQNVYASAKGKYLSGIGKTDGTYKTSLDTDTLETEDSVVKIDKKRSGRDYVYLEWHNKKAKEMGSAIDEKIAEAERAPATKKEAKELKRRFIEQMKKNKEKIRKTTIARRVEKINRKDGIVEEQEFYNGDNERIGWSKVKQFSIKNYQLSNKAGGNTKQIRIPVEIDGEMESIEGKSKFKTKVKDVKINEGASFRWIK